ncbi:MAG: carbohydrate kinase family protein [Candidatus Bathyarchaeia archaeon]
MFDIVTVGHFTIDYIKSPRRLDSKPTLGGPPTYTSIAARRLGANVSVISKVGEDFQPKYLKWLKNQGVDLSGLNKVKGTLTTSFMLNYFENGERQMALKNRAPPIEAEDVPDNLETNSIHVAPIANEVSYKVIDKLRRLTNTVSLDPQGFLRRFTEEGMMYLAKMDNLEILEKIDIFKSSEREIEVLTGESDVLKAMIMIHEHGAKIVIVTRGMEGSILYFKNRFHKIPAARPKIVVDTTGAGDAFIGGFMAEYIEEKEPVWCACVGSAATSFVTEKIGPRGFAPRKEVYERADEVYEKTSIII